MQTRRITAWLLAGALTVSICAPARSAAKDEGPFNTEATIVYYDSSGNATLDPAEPQNGSSYSHETLLAIYDTLIRFDQDGRLTPGLAESWKVNEDLTELTLNLRHGVTFHDGTKFDADAVKRNFERSAALGKRAGNTVADTFRQIVAIETVGDDVVKLKLKEPSGQIEFRLAYNSGMMVSPAAFAPTASGEPAFGATLKGIGAGPYKVKFFEPNIKTVMTRFDGYWRKDEGRPAGFENHYVPEARARMNAVRSGQATIALIDPRQIQEAKAAGLIVQAAEKNALWDIYLNVSRPGLSDVRVRQALMYALDREALSDAIGFGSARPTEQLWATTSPFYIKELDSRYPYDPVKARALIAEAGFKDGVDITLLLLNTTEYRQLAEALQGLWAEVGVRLKFDVIDVSQYNQFSRPTPRGDIMIGRNGGRGDAVEGLMQIVGTGGGVNPGGAAIPRIDELLGQARHLEATDPKRLAVMLELSREISEQAANIPVITRANVYAYKPGCILDLKPYMPAGDERFNDVHVGATCR
jgi:peptide/nickel transport system substrate-binding protein